MNPDLRSKLQDIKSYPKTRICKHCRKRKAFNKFAINKALKLGRLSVCHICKKDEAFFGGNRKIAMERDGYKCVHCGMDNKTHNKKYKRSLTVDHIDGNGHGVPAERKNNVLENLQTLCLSCHSKKDAPHHKYFNRARCYFNIRSKNWSVRTEWFKKFVQLKIFKTKEECLKFMSEWEEIYCFEGELIKSEECGNDS